MKIIPFDRLPNADLVIDAVYEGGSAGNTGDDPISKLLKGAGNQGGFRAAGRGDDKRFVVLYSSGEDKDWPDNLDPSTGRYVYYGDNKTPGHELHETGPGGNKILRQVFEHLRVLPDRSTIPPFFIFSKYPTPLSSRSVQFKGLAAPGYPGLPSTAELIAVWKTSKGQRFQNYQSTFTVLNVPVVERAWLKDVSEGKALSEKAPDAWMEWIRSGRYLALASESAKVIREQYAQVPVSETKIGILEKVWKHFKDSPLSFESFAARLFQMHDQRVIIDQLTRAVVDGGRDAIGRYQLGLSDDPVYVDFSLEAKCYRPPILGNAPNTVGVKDVSRLISRIKHRQFGVLVTTSTIGRQAYEEVRGDRHPIIFFCGKDIADILTMHGLNTPQLVEEMLRNEFPLT